MMHPRNKYCKNPANFAEISEKYPKFRNYLMPTSTGYTINFKDPKALRELTVSLLHHDFGLDVELPLDRLIPTVTLRLNYIHWIEDLMQMFSKTSSSAGQTRGIDIGTGASCIYPLLGAKINGWKFCASEVDELSFHFACDNVKRNKLEEHICVCLVSPNVVLAHLLAEGENYDFSMCNPPFFADKSEAVGNVSRTGCRPQPSSVCTGTETETVTSGGEVEFVGRMIEDSLELKSRVKWYTTMLGKKSSMSSVVAKLKQNNITKIVTTEFCQGRTMRWGVAWTFLSDVEIEGPPKKKRKNKPLKFSFFPKSVCSKESLSDIKNKDQLISSISERFKAMLSDLQIQILTEGTETTRDAIITKLHCTARQNTWANQRKKRREAARRLEASKQSTRNDTAIVSLESKSENEKTSMKISHIDRIQDEGADHSHTSSGHQTCGNENDQSKLRLPSTVKSANEQLIVVGGSSDVISPNNGADITELRAHPTLKYVTTEENETQNEKIVKSDDKHKRSPAELENKTSLPHMDKKRIGTASQSTTSHSHKLLKSDSFGKNEEFLLEFFFSLEAKEADLMRDNEMFLQMDWIDGQDKNCMYQLFQYFQNHINSLMFNIQAC